MTTRRYAQGRRSAEAAGRKAAMIASGPMLFSAASTTESAMVDSTRREGSAITDSAASESVIECATVNEVATLKTSQKVSANRCAGAHCRLLKMKTEGRSNDKRNKMWSKPIQMCHVPSRT